MSEFSDNHKNQTLFGATNQLFNQPQTIEAAKLTGCKIFGLSNA